MQYLRSLLHHSAISELLIAPQRHARVSSAHGWLDGEPRRGEGCSKAVPRVLHEDRWGQGELFGRPLNHNVRNVACFKWVALTCGLNVVYLLRGNAFFVDAGTWWTPRWNSSSFLVEITLRSHWPKESWRRLKLGWSPKSDVEENVCR